MISDDLCQSYADDPDFKEYVDKLMITYSWSLEKALQSPITKNYRDYLISSKKDKITC